MEGQLSVPFHFAAEFLFLAVAAGAFAFALRRFAVERRLLVLAGAGGFALLCVAQIVHGARVPGATDEGSVVLIVLRTIGFALIAMLGPSMRSVSAPAPPPASALAALFVPIGGVQLISAGRTAGWAFLPGIAAGVVAVGGLASWGRNRDRGALSYAVAFLCLAASELVLALGRNTTAALVSTHALRFAGAVFLAGWLSTFVAQRVRLRFVSVFVASLVAVVLVLAAALNVVIGRNLQHEELSRATVTATVQADALRRIYDNDAQNALSIASLLARPTGTLNLDRNTLSAFTCFYRDLTFLELVDPSAKVIATAAGPSPACNPQRNLQLRPQVPRQLALPLAGSDEVQKALRGAPIGSLEAFPTELASVGAAPVSVGGRVRAVLVVGHVVDDRVLQRAKGNRSGDDLTVLVGGRVVATTLGGSRDQLSRELAGGALGERVRRVVEEGPSKLQAVVRVAGVRTFSAYVPLQRSFDQREVLATLVVSRNQNAVLGAQSGIDRILFLIALLSAMIAAAFASRAIGRLLRPIGSLTRAAEAVRVGDLTSRVQVSSQDEIGVLGRVFNEMARSLDQTTADLRASAGAEATLRARMEAIMQSMGDGVIATDADGSIVAFNAAAERMTGSEAAVVLGQHLTRVLFGDDGRGGSISHAALTGRDAPQATIERADGDAVPAALSSAPLAEESGTATGRVIVLRDTTTQIQAERMKSEFLSNVSHELRTPLTPIKGYTEILKRKKIPKEKAESFLDGILESTSRLERIVEILVEFAAIEAGRLKPHTEPVGVKVFIDDHLATWRKRSAGHRFAAKIPPRMPTMDADPRLLGKCIDELIDNAVKFSPDGGKVEIEARLSNGRAKPRMIRIDVRDHGIGIAPEAMAGLFMDFRQLDGSETREFGGLGLGLTYARRVAAVHGGDVSAQSTPGKGSTFSLMVPASDSRKERDPS